MNNEYSIEDAHLDLLYCFQSFGRVDTAPSILGTELTFEYPVLLKQNKQRVWKHMTQF